MEKTILKVWPDLVTVPEDIRRMKEEYESQGFSCRTNLNTLLLELQDGIVGIYWSDGAFYQEILSKDEITEGLSKLKMR